MTACRESLFVMVCVLRSLMLCLILLTKLLSSSLSFFKNWMVVLMFSPMMPI